MPDKDSHLLEQMLQILREEQDANRHDPAVASLLQRIINRMQELRESKEPK